MASIEMAGMSLDADDDDDSSDSGDEGKPKEKRRIYTEEEKKKGNENKEKFRALVDGLVSSIVPQLKDEIHRLNGTGEEINVTQEINTIMNYHIMARCYYGRVQLDLDFLHGDLLDDNADIRLWTVLYCNEKSEKTIVYCVEKTFRFKCVPQIDLETISSGGTTLHRYIKETSKRIVLYHALQSIDSISAWSFEWREKRATISLGFTRVMRWLHLELCISESEDVVLEILYKEWYTINPSEVKAYNMDVKICSKEEFIRFINNELGIPPLKSQLLDLERRIDALRLTT